MTEISGWSIASACIIDGALHQRAANRIAVYPDRIPRSEPGRRHSSFQRGSIASVFIPWRSRSTTRLHGQKLATVLLIRDGIETRDQLGDDSMPPLFPTKRRALRVDSPTAMASQALRFPRTQLKRPSRWKAHARTSEGCFMQSCHSRIRTSTFMWVSSR